MRTVVGILSCAAIILIAFEAFETVILPRRVTRRFRLTALFYRLTWRPWSAIARRIGKPRRRERFLGYYGPFSTPLLLSVWAAVMIFAFAGILWSFGVAIQAPEKNITFGTYLYLSGAAYFGVGFGDVTARAGLGRFFSVLEGGVGFGFLAMVIGYFPVLYQAFSRREVNIALLDARAGSPSSAQELLRHYGQGHDLAAINPGLHEAEHWTGELLESHISYPVLSYFRSQHDNQSWIGSITTILDACSLAMTCIDGLPPRQAELTFAMARHAVVDIAQILKTAPRPPEPARLPPATFRKLRDELATAGILLRDDEESRVRLSQLRSMYEPYVNALSRYLVMPLPPWVPERRAMHNWETSAWGRAGRTQHSPRATAFDPVEDDH